MTGNELHDSAERGPVDRDGARGKLPKHNTSFSKMDPRQVSLAGI